MRLLSSVAMYMLKGPSEEVRDAREEWICHLLLLGGGYLEEALPP